MQTVGYTICVCTWLLAAVARSVRFEQRRIVPKAPTSCLHEVPSFASCNYDVRMEIFENPQTARLAGCSMDALALVSSWDKGRLRSAVLPVTVEGLR